MKKFIALIFVMVFMAALVGCNNKKEQPESEIELVDDHSDSFSGLDEETEQFLFGTWEVETFLGFQEITKDDIEWPDGEKIIGKSVIINERLFSSKDFGKEYDEYAKEVINPQYSVVDNLTGSEFFYSYRIAEDLSKIYSDNNDTVQVINVESSDKNNPSNGLNLIVVNNNRLIIMLNCDFFELGKISE